MPPPSIDSVLASPIALALAGALALAACGGATIERRAASPQDFVEATVPLGRADATTALRAFFNDGLAPPGTPNRFPPEDRLHGFFLYPRDVPEGTAAVPLPDDVDLAANSTHDPAMARYLALPLERRRDDLYLYHPLDLDWPSEDFVDGKPAPFTCHFLIHLEALGPEQTRIEILEVGPRVDAGRRLRPTAHGVGVGWVRDLRLVPPTTRDRVELLERIRTSLAQAAPAR